ncbi:hypothetical protein SAMN02745148_00205 [Modicisalibacter ilicicola DSM 19980]|uniref:Zinc-ribbon domain-containing protein n=1 Tax=Modicisalibacter ilicicola DSM 19980 TaxID=1121942 RepID=A0A1M4SRV9_9GAMM|nr:hypothetical protein [Halomonas ilicicola]SHE34901.1 hypothetical protein SAMN02745148_00205 [Halomonas ilicicola DSM 19980]
MALVACPRCSHNASDLAFKCSQCGSRLRKRKHSLGAWLLCGGALLGGLLILGMLGQLLVG